MKEQKASSFATLRISTVLAMLWALPVGPVSAIPIALTGGAITVENFQISSGDVHTFVFFAGPGFELTTDGYFDQIQFGNTVNHPLDALPLGSITDFSGIVQVISGSTPGFPEYPPPATVLYGGESYFATGDIVVSTPSFAVGPLAVTLPFILSGQIHATNFMGTDFDFEISGAGTVPARYFPFPTGQDDSSLWVTGHIQYTIEPPPIPEPTSWMLLGSGLLGVAARRNSTRPNR